MLLYLDTDSCFWAVHHPSFEDNILPSMKTSYDLQKNNFVNSKTLLGNFFRIIKNIEKKKSHLFSAGYLVSEWASDTLHIYGEKMYRIGYKDATQPQIHLKGIMKGLHPLLNKEENSRKLCKDQQTVIIQTGFKRVNQGISMVTETKSFNSAIQPKKRKFVEAGYSVTY